MFTQVEVFTPHMITAPLSFEDGTAETDPFQIKNITGLGPVNATINTTQYGSLDGEIENGSFTGKRNIVLTVGLNPNWADQSIERLRQILYSYFMPKNPVTLRFTSTHMVEVEIEGRVETFEPNMFEKDPLYQISIICPKPYFVSRIPSVVKGVTGDLTDTDFTDIEYQGNVPTGFVLTVSSDGASSDGEIRVFNENSDYGVFIVDTEVNLDTSMEYSTMQGNKYVRSIDVGSGTPTNILNVVSPGSDWIQLHEGPNNFRVQSDIEGLIWTLVYSARYGGL